MFLTRHSRILIRHSRILTRHSRVLTRHSRVGGSPEQPAALVADNCKGFACKACGGHDGGCEE